MNTFSISPSALLVIYGALVVLSALAGGWTLLALRLTHARMQMAISLVAGLMLGMALLHFLPHAAHQLPSLEYCVFWVLAGFLAMFFLQRFLPYHHHDVPSPDAPAQDHPHEEHSHSCSHAHGHSHSHSHVHAHEPDSGKIPAVGYSWVATMVGMSLHSLIGGVALAAAVMAENQMHGAMLVGLGTALATILHKPFDSMAIATLMAAEGCSRRVRFWITATFAAVTPLGMLLFWVGANVSDRSPLLLGAALAFCAGTFLCIACADLLPELQFHTHDRLKLSAALIVGLAISILIGHLGEGSHAHGPSPAPASSGADTGDHSGHNHAPGESHSH